MSTASTTKPRRSCDRCYAKKERCTFNSHGASSCTLCERHQVDCTFVRVRRRVGRRPKVNRFGSRDYMHVWDSDRTSQKSAVPGAEASTSSSTLALPNTPATTATSATEWATEDSSEGDAETLSIRTDRSPRAVSHADPATPSLDLEQRNPRGYRVTTRWLQNQSQFVARELFEDRYVDLDVFYTTNDIFMSGPSFANQYRDSLLLVYRFSPAYLRDIGRAMLSALTWARLRTSSYEQVDITTGALTLQRLRTATVCDLSGAVMAIGLGPILAAFDLLTSGIGSALILRHALRLAKPWYQTLLDTPALNPVTISSIFWDTAHCLLNRQIPVVEFEARDEHVIDRVAGLCTTLLPLLYRLCTLSHGIAQSSLQVHLEPLLDLHAAISSWTRTLSAEEEQRFSTMECLQLNTQARMYRTAALLLIHRIMNPMGTNDYVAVAYADTVALELSNYLSAAAPRKKLQFVFVPIFLSMLESRTLSEEVWKSLKIMDGPSLGLDKLAKAVKAAWDKRDAGFSGSLFDLLESGPSFVVLP
ncbi:hypothetical protein H2204_007471 [Knufia peltigerae]|uniref:Zn(2)-C6 fungal-type domain-containing protein n=1 Tax=Knufia peltigerae TaxID=1002370 RepID=A0AA38Y1Q5_9EURO|nr:hypothetical protein H2204_007471 [Knufia peltigerae]